MATQTSDGRRGDSEVSRREARAHRILDAAAELVLRWGYDKTTIDDVARQAGVAKGTIYLHWSTREALFAALLQRERADMLAEVRRAVADDSGAVTHRDLARHLCLALLRRPLVRAVFLGDAEVLGKLIRNKPRSDTVAALRPSFERYLETLRTHGAVRTDLSIAELINVIMGAVYGSFLITPLLPYDYRLPDDRLADLLADTVHRALDAGREVAPQDAEAVAQATLDHLDFTLQLAAQRSRSSLEGQKESS